MTPEIRGVPEFRCFKLLVQEANSAKPRASLRVDGSFDGCSEPIDRCKCVQETCHHPKMTKISDGLRHAIEEAGESLRKLANKHAESRDKMMVELERRGYHVHGKSDLEIEDIIKLPPSKKH